MSELKAVLNHSTRGISICKDSLSLAEQYKIKNELTIQPFVPPNSLQTRNKFSIYRESKKKLYVPRFYAKQKFNYTLSPMEYCKHINICKNNNNSFQFKGDLREYQKTIIESYIQECQRSGCGLLEIPCGRGKCLGRDTPILLHNGATKLVQNIVNGDILLGDDLQPRIVSGIHSGRSKMYTIYQEGGITYRVNCHHILTVYNSDTCLIQDIHVEDCLDIMMHTDYNNSIFGIRVNIESNEYLFTNIKIQLDNNVEEDDYFGFTVDKNHRFLLGDGTVTHNTVMALNIISILKFKTLVIVHKEFLLNQWIERIQQFLPNVTVGKIQGKIIQTENCDIVIGMLQSLSMKEYDSNVFQQFGLTIVDECHHIGAEVFSRSLFKIVSPYMLGLSATMERKDKTSKVFRMFLGDVVYSEKPKTDQAVLIRAIMYENEDDNYAATEYNYRGQVHYSRMIKKICEYEYRTFLILRILEDIKNEIENRQIMILAHNKSILRVLFEHIKERNVGTVGYYVGGMKESELKETEKHDIILATYAMAEEALDIKTLSALILATPKTDVTQAVGRILRMKHTNPLVIDIVDQHEIFQRQWLKRKSYYNRCNYIIKQIESKNYNNEFHKWNQLLKTKKSKSNQNVNTGKCLISI